MYKLQITKDVNKFLNTLAHKQLSQIIKKIFEVLKNPRPIDSKMLKGSYKYRRVDIGEYRIMYKLTQDTVFVSVIGKRNDSYVYRKFFRKH